MFPLIKQLLSRKLPWRSHLWQVHYYIMSQSNMYSMDLAKIHIFQTQNIPFETNCEHWFESSTCVSCDGSFFLL